MGPPVISMKWFGQTYLPIRQWVPFFTASSAAPVISCLLDDSHSNRWEVITVVLICISSGLVMLSIIFVLAILMLFLDRCLFGSFDMRGRFVTFLMDGLEPWAHYAQRDRQRRTKLLWDIIYMWDLKQFNL